MACFYYISLPGQPELKFDSKKALADHIRTNQLYDVLKITGRKGTKTTKDLADVLRQMVFGENNFTPDELKKFQTELLDQFIELESQSQTFYKMGAPIALTKGLGKSMDQIDNVKKNLTDVGVNSELDSSVPFDVRYLLTGDDKYKTDNSDKYYHKITANNIRIMNEVDALSRTMFMERTPSFIRVTNDVLDNLKDVMDTDRTKELRDEIAAFTQISAYKKWLEINDNKTTTLRNSLIYDSESKLDTIVDITKKAIELSPNNTFLQFVLPVSTTVKIGKKIQKNINNKDLLNTIEGKTRGRLEPDIIATLMDSFAELYQNPKTQFHAKALFDYLIVKDGLIFKNRSFIKMLPTAIFKDMSIATEMATEVMAAITPDQFKGLLKKYALLDIVNKEGETVPYFSSEEKTNFNKLFKSADIAAIRAALYSKVFGMSPTEITSRFIDVYSTDVRHQYNLQLTRRSVGTPLRPAKGVSFAKDEKTNISYLHVNMFTDEFTKMVKGEERNKVLGTTISNLEDAGFYVSPISETDNEDASKNRIYLEFKKYIRMRINKKYLTYKLISIDRDGKTHGPESLVAVGESIPHGVSAVYQPITPVGSANSTGVANLGRRPTPDEAKKILGDKIKTEVPTQIGVKISPNVGRNSFNLDKVIFSEDQSSGYANRTAKNASADATIAIAIDFNSAGEKLTKSSVLTQKKKYISVDANQLIVNPIIVESIVIDLNSVNARTLNIAGNGLYTMRGKYTQSQIDIFTENLLRSVISSPNLQNPILQIRTGGQTGFDEAGAKAGIKLGIPTLILAPKGWKFRDVNGNDISNEQLFKNRFDISVESQYPYQQSVSTPTIEEGTKMTGGMFGGLTQLPYDPNQEDAPLGFFSDEEKDDSKNCKK